jgi:hypothetical protein
LATVVTILQVSGATQAAVMTALQHRRPGLLEAQHDAAPAQTTPALLAEVSRWMRVDLAHMPSRPGRHGVRSVGDERLDGFGVTDRS